MNNEIKEMQEDLKKLNSFNDPKNKLRDHFAGLAMNGILSGQVDKQGNGRLTDEVEAHSIAKESYLIADAMLKARKEVSGE